MRQAVRKRSTVAAEHRRAGRGDRPRRGARQAVRRKEEPLSAREKRRLVQLVACGGIFVLLVAAKLLLPAKMAAIDQRLGATLRQSMDVQAVFSAVGRAFTGEEGAARDVYQAVFHPQEADVLETASVGELTLGEPAALDTLREYRPESTAALEETPPDGEKTAESLAYILYSDQNLPENVSLEQAILGFDYCTPVTGAVSSGFGYREHPVEGEERFHYGLDLAADTGTAVACFADGTVTAVGESSSYGKYCIVDHGDGWSTLYAHCSRVTASSGAAVNEGQKIAEVGETGVATGPHLHFELQKDGTYLNPIYYVG